MYGISRYGQSYYGVDGFGITLSALLLDAGLYNALVGNVVEPLEYFADVYVGGVQIANGSNITITRQVWSESGQCEISFHHVPGSTPTGIAPNAEVQVYSGLKRLGVPAFQSVFLGRMDIYEAPTPGTTLARVTAFDYGAKLSKAEAGASMVGYLSTWLSARVAEIGATGLYVSEIGTAANITRSINLNGYRGAMAAARMLATGDKWRYVFQRGLGELVVLDPTALSTVTPLFILAKALDYSEIVDTQNRFNRVPYSNYTGYAQDIVGYAITVNPDGSSTVSATSLGGGALVSGTYNDTADQTTYGIASAPILQNPIPTTTGEFDALAASYATESQRRKWRFKVPHNPFFDLGNVCQYGTEKYFAASIRHEISAGSFPISEWELWSV